ncbi:MAG: glycosyltransferase, partial [Actinobacteria bacterium]|nr:glycosyltransferase [Actinomycetota bacterium]
MVGPARASRTLGVVVVHRPDRAITELRAVRDLVAQVDELLIVRNGTEPYPSAATADVVDPTIRVICFETNRGTAAAWNAALSSAKDRDFRYLYLLDQDSVVFPDAVATARACSLVDEAAAVVQPALPGRFGLDPFPWNTVASGSLFEVEALHRMGGFDERLFVDEVDHEMLARLMTAGHRVKPLPSATIDHRVGSPRQIRVLGCTATVSGHQVARRRLQGRSAGLLVRRYVRSAPATSARLLLRHALTAAKDLAAGERASASALVSGLGCGAATGRAPSRAAEQACP